MEIMSKKDIEELGHSVIGNTKMDTITQADKDP